MDNKPLARFRRAVYAISALLIIILFIAVPTGFGLLNLGWATSFVSVLLLLVLFLLNWHSDFAVQFLQRLKLDLLVPAFREVINHQKNLYQCRLVVRNMEYTLGFYRLWEMIQPNEIEQPITDETHSRLKRWLKKWQAALRWQRLSEWLQKDPLVKELTLPAGIAHALLTAGTDLEKITGCAAATVKYLKQQREHKELHLNSANLQAGVKVQRMLEEQAWAALLQLLYQEQHGPDARVVWGDIKHNAQLIDDLAALLVWSGQLPVPEPDLPYTDQELSVLLAKLETFSLSEVKNSIYADQERRRQNRVVVDQLSDTLDYFHLFVQMARQKTQSPAGSLLSDQIQPPYGITDSSGKSSFSPNLRRILIDTLMGASEEERLQTCAGQVAHFFEDPQPALMEKILCLLYRELYGPLEAEHTLWLANKRNANFVAGLSQVLLASGDLPDKEIEEPYQTEELAHLVAALENFNLEHLKSVIAVDQKKRFKTRFEISRLEHTLNFYKLFSLFAEQQVEWLEPQVSGTFKRAVQDALVSQAIHSSHEPGTDVWIDDFIQGLRSSVAPARLEGALARATRPTQTHATAGGIDPRRQNTEAVKLAEPSDVLLTMVALLYREQHGFATKVLWGDLLHQPPILESLAGLLVDSQRLPVGDADLPYGASELHELIKTLDTFELDRVRAIVQVDLERRRKNREAVERLMSVLQYYNLYALFNPIVRNRAGTQDRLSESFRRQLIDLPPAQTGEPERIADLAGRLAQQMQLFRLQEALDQKYRAGASENSAVLPELTLSEEASLKDLLILLYWKYYQGETQAYWQTGKLAAGFIHNLAAILLHSHLLPARENYFPYRLTDLEYILTRLNSFDLAMLTDQLEWLNEIWQYAVTYQEFLHKNDITSVPLQSRDLLINVDLPLPAGRSVEAIQDFLLWQGQEALKYHYAAEKPGKLPDITGYNEAERFYVPGAVDLAQPEGAALLRCLSLVSLIIFVTEKVTESLRLRERPCQLAAPFDKALLIASAYLEFKKYLRNEYKIEGKDFISIDYIARTWADKIKENQPKPIGYRDELETIRDTLRRGEWPQQIPVVIEKTLENIGQQHQEINQKLDELAAQSAFIRKVIEAAFRKLTTPTIERYLDARKQIAYLMAFRVESGTLASLLDLLVQKDEDKLEQLGQTLKINFFMKTTEKRKYNFGQFCPFARIGVVPTGMGFEEFFKEFQDDFGKIVDARKRLLSETDLSHNLDQLSNVEVIVSRFGLTGQNYFAFEKEGITHPKAIDKVKELLPYELETEMMSQVIEYQEENILKFVLQLPVKELVSCYMTLTNDESLLLEQEELVFKDTLLKSQGFINLEDLARACRSTQVQLELEQQLTQLLVTHLEKSEFKRCQVMAKAYVDILVVFGALI